MGKQKFRCNQCGCLLNGGKERRMHCQTHHPAVAFGKLDMYFKADFQEITDDEYRGLKSRPIMPGSSNVESPQTIKSIVNNQTFDDFDKSENLPGWSRDELASNDNIFITGKAGTGKTTLLKEIVKSLKLNGKNVVIVAPTGVAAKNAGGETIHSFLRLPIAPYLPNVNLKGLYSLEPAGVDVVNHLDVIIIDEISMVRCDLLDMMDDVLRHYRKSSDIFGGVRMIVFGDLYQLMPVVPTKEWTLLKEWYRSPYFFSSKVYERNPFKMITLKKVYRQTDSNFIELLNEVRKGKLSDKNFKLLSKKYKESAHNNEPKNVIRLTTHNRLADSYNKTIFDSLQGSSYEYTASISGYIHYQDYPAKYKLWLKKGARVMFIKNDTSRQKAYVNGPLATVVKCSYDKVTVRLDESGTILTVEPATWFFDEYYYNISTHTLELRHCGSFTQIPLKLAWAITIHKSQGLTFDKVIIDAGKAFTYGQVYVALSRCRRFEGITLATPISAEGIQTDPIVKHFMNPKMRNEDLPAFTIQKKSSRKPKKPDGLYGLDLLKWLAEKDFTIEEMSEETGYNNTGMVYHDLCKLISKGKLGLACRMSNAKINDIENAWSTVGLDADIREVKPYCELKVNFGEIQMVRSYLEYMRKRGKY